MKDTVSRAKYSDFNGNSVGLTQAFHCAPGLHFDRVRMPSSKGCYFSWRRMYLLVTLFFYLFTCRTTPPV